MKAPGTAPNVAPWPRGAAAFWDRHVVCIACGSVDEPTRVFTALGCWWCLACGAEWRIEAKR